MSEYKKRLGKLGPICSEAVDSPDSISIIVEQRALSGHPGAVNKVRGYPPLLDMHRPFWKKRKEQKASVCLCNLILSCLPMKFQVRLLEQAFQVSRCFEYGKEKPTALPLLFGNE